MIYAVLGFVFCVGWACGSAARFHQLRCPQPGDPYVAITQTELDLLNVELKALHDFVSWSEQNVKEMRRELSVSRG